MDRHEKGIEKNPDRLDQPLPEWSGSYGGDQRRLPKVVQKLLHGRILSAEEKAELLWRYFEIDQRARARVARDRKIFAVMLLLIIVAYIGVFHRGWVAASVMAWLSPPASPG
jgi:hypothetical protein